MTLYLVWDNSRKRWWRVGDAGYTADLALAALHDEDTAVSIALKAARAGTVRESVTLVVAPSYAEMTSRVTLRSVGKSGSAI